jgi:hypothetical protein
VKHHLRKEKNCLNCGSEVTGRFCTDCGQENIEPKEKVSYLVGHFLGDITHYDSKFFKSIKLLLFKPGFLTKEYLAGKRTKYLNPIRMYVFISAVFFLFLLLHKDDEENIKEEGNTQVTNALKQHLADSLRHVIHWPAKANAYDSGRIHAFQDISASLDTVAVKGSNDEELSFHLGQHGATFVLREDRFSTVREYDSVQRILPDSAKNKGLLYWMVRTNIRLKEKYGSRRQVMVSENFHHSIPKLMFVLLPVFALFIYLLHSRKKYYYAQHIIYSVHFHTFIFFWLLIMSLLSLIPAGKIFNDIINSATWIIPLIYLVISLKNVYQQALGWAIFKGLLILVFYAAMLIIGILLVAIISFFTA